MSAKPVRPPFARRPIESPRALTVGRGTLVAAGAAFTLLTAWASTTTYLLVHREEVTAQFMGDQAQMQYAYEARIAEMRARLDRVASQKLLEQDGIETRVAQLVGRQVELETRAALVASLVAHAEPLVRAGTLKGLPLKAAEPAAPETARAFAPLPAKPAPAEEPFQLRFRSSAAPSAPGRGGRGDEDTEARLDRIRQSLTAIEGTQVAVLEGLLAGAKQEASRMRQVIASTGLDAESLKPSKDAAVGGPLVPVPVDPSNGPFEAMVDRVGHHLTAVQRLTQVTNALPFARPVPVHHETTSGFGVRSDPFTRRPAMHTGLDFRVEHGSPIRAAGAGVVVTAEFSGGYGNMVEVDHGNGVATRYAHLSSLAVIPGQKVVAGTVVGRAGSTGRSTGTHLHYETRIDGEPVDPQRFLRAGARLFAATSTTAVATAR